MSVLAFLAAALAASASAGLAFTLAYAARVARLYPPVAARIETSLGPMHIACFGAADAPRGAALLIHGASGNFADLASVLAAPLAEAGFRVFSADRPGHGWSARARSPRPASPEVQATMIVEAMGRLGVAQAFVITHSLGGPVGLAMALNAPGFTRALMLLAPVSHPWPGGVAFYYPLAAHWLWGPLFRWTLLAPIGSARLKGGVASVFAPCPTPEGYIERTRVPLVLRPAHFKANAEDVVACFGEVTALSKRYGAIRAPVAIVIGEEDGVVLNNIHAAGLMREVAGAKLTALKGVGHSPHHSAANATMAAILALAERAEFPPLIARQKTGVLPDAL